MPPEHAVSMSCLWRKRGSAPNALSAGIAPLSLFDGTFFCTFFRQHLISRQIRSGSIVGPVRSPNQWLIPTYNPGSLMHWG